MIYLDVSIRSGGVWAPEALASRNPCRAAPLVSPVQATAARDAGDGVSRVSRGSAKASARQTHDAHDAEDDHDDGTARDDRGRAGRSEGPWRVRASIRALVGARPSKADRRVGVGTHEYTKSLERTHFSRTRHEGGLGEGDGPRGTPGANKHRKGPGDRSAPTGVPYPSSGIIGGVDTGSNMVSG